MRFDYDWSKRCCLVTGGAGFIGTRLCRELHERGARVVALSRSAASVAGSSEPVACDITDLAAVRRVFGSIRPEVVFHLAARVTGSRDMDEVQGTLRDNLVGAVNVLLAASEAQTPRVLSMGSLQEPDDRIHGIPSSPYAAAKLAASAYARMFAELYRLPVTVIRSFMVYGPGQVDFAKVVPYIVSSLLRGEPAMLSSGRQAFDWVFVDDVVEALLVVAARRDLEGATIDVGTGVLTTVRDVATSLALRLGAPELIQLGAVPDRRLEPTRAADVETVSRLCGWRAKVALSDGLGATVDWYRGYFSQKF